RGHAKVGELVTKAVEFAGLARAQAKSRFAPSGRLIVLAESGQTQQAAPDAGRRALLEQDGAVALNDHEPFAAQRAVALGPWRGEKRRLPRQPCLAVAGQRAVPALRVLADADAGAQIHDGLGVSGDIGAWCFALGEGP